MEVEHTTFYPQSDSHEPSDTVLIAPCSETSIHGVERDDVIFVPVMFRVKGNTCLNFFLRDL